MVLNSKGQVTIPTHLRVKYGLHAGDEVEVVEVGGALQIVRAEGAESRGQRMVQRLRNTATGREVAGMSTDEIMALLRGERPCGDRVVITRNGRPEAVIMSVSDLEVLEDTLDLLSTPGALDEIRAAEAEIARGEAIGADELRRLLAQRMRAEQRGE
jgi:AbrB family looped-hinge helix DNA binding protein